MAQQERDTQAARDYAVRFGALVREHRDAMRMTQDDLALATGVGRRFIIELEGGKPSCQLGKALVVAIAVGLQPVRSRMAEHRATITRCCRSPRPI